MSFMKIFLCITAGWFVASSLSADIYEWTDKDGVTHYTNYSPPPEAKIIMKTEELPYDEAADRARLEAEREEQLELTRLELADREAELERREALAEQRLAEVDRQADETLRETKKLLNEARNDRHDNGNFGYADYYRGYYPYRYKDRYYYRNETSSIFFSMPPRIDHFKRYRYKKQHYGYGATYRRNRYDGEKYPHQKAPHRDSGLRLHNESHRDQLSVRSHSSNHMGRGHSSRARSAPRSRHD